MTINAFRAYFELVDPNADEPEDVRAFVLNFGGEVSEQTGIKDVEEESSHFTLFPSGWYNLDGRKLQARPAVRGVYLNNGRKVLVRDKR